MFLHIGQGKTGTSTIQHFMNANREVLRERGYLYPKMPGERHVELSLYARGDRMTSSPAWSRARWETPAELREFVENRLVRRIRRSDCDNVVLSDEALWRLPLEGLVSVLAPLVDETVFVAYLRRQDEHVVSRYKQTMREGSTLLLSEFISRPVVLQSWQYDASLRSLQEQFPGARIIARPYHRSRFQERGLVQDFLDTIGADVGSGEDAVPDEPRVNTSLDAYATEYLRRHNAEHGRADRTFNRRLTRISDGPDLVMAGDEHQRLWEQFRESNARLVRDFIPDAQDVFLSEPRPRSGLTQADITDEDISRVEERISIQHPAQA